MLSTGLCSLELLPNKLSRFYHWWTILLSTVLPSSWWFKFLILFAFTFIRFSGNFKVFLRCVFSFQMDFIVFWSGFIFVACFNSDKPQRIRRKFHKIWIKHNFTISGVPHASNVFCTTITTHVDAFYTVWYKLTVLMWTTLS